MSHRLLFLFALILSFQLQAADLINSPHPVSGKQITLEDITPSDVLARTLLVQHETALISLEMGKPIQQFSDIDVSGAKPYEVFFQALTLFRKANQLSLELTGNQAVEPSVPQREIHPVDAWNMTDTALKRLLVVKQALNIPEKTLESQQPESTTPNDVIKAIMRANRQVSLLLEKHFEPADTFQQLTLAVNYTTTLLSHYPGTKYIASEPELERRKLPSHAYAKLINCYHILGEITETLALKGLKLNKNSQFSESKSSADSYDISLLILSKLDYLHSKQSSPQLVRKSYYPGYKLPSHVYQRAELLHRQLLTLKKLIGKNPLPLGLM